MSRRLQADAITPLPSAAGSRQAGPLLSRGKAVVSASAAGHQRHSAAVRAAATAAMLPAQPAMRHANQCTSNAPCSITVGRPQSQAARRQQARHAQLGQRWRQLQVLLLTVLLLTGRLPTLQQLKHAAAQQLMAQHCRL